MLTKPHGDKGMHEVEAQGARISALGFGTFRLDGAAARRMVGHALEIGYRHIDTAQMYGNEAEVGAAVAGSGVARDEIRLTTEIWPDNFRHLPCLYGPGHRVSRRSE